MREIAFYRTPAGRCPAEDFLDELTGKQAQKVTWVLRLIAEMDHVPTQYWKKLSNTDDIWEARVNFGRETFRLLGFYATSDRVVLTNGFQKKSRRIPRSEIELAEQRKHDYKQEREQ